MKSFFIADATFFGFGALALAQRFFEPPPAIFKSRVCETPYNGPSCFDPKQENNTT
jgi:hypothetical protein